MNLAGQSLKFENGQWIAETGISGGVDRREAQRLRRRNQQLEEENNLLRLKVDILLDMVSRPTLNQRELPRKRRDSLLGPRYFLLGRKPKSAGQKASLFPSTSASGSRKCSSVRQGRCTRLLASASGVPLAAMAAAAAAAAGGPGAPLSPDELLPKGDSEKTEEELEEEDDEELDETLSERLWGLTEMFPERVRSAAGATFDLSLFVAQKMYRFSRAALWIGTTSFMILVLPVVFETEKLQMEQQQQLQQRQILLGPNTGLSGGMPGALPSLPGKI
ncbi:LOW QUALITY PROTEIN: mitochondrial import receptor subunit TOM22 homolog [Ailuropoda melanoleuca]|nr:LOW QUALITY PROTEIN: mitochondrial import receptor subunit TOM22 homolog [Ailuropoda melanoleuca]